MPKLYGKPGKTQLRKGISELKAKLGNEWQDKLSTRSDLKYAECKIAVLEAKLQRIEQKVRELAEEISRDIAEDVRQRFLKIVRRQAA